MKEPDDEGLASHIGPESCADVREGVGEALRGGRVGWVLSREILNVQDADAVKTGGRPHRVRRYRKPDTITTKKVNWVLDADIQSFFDTLEHGWLVRFLKHRVADRRVLRLIQKWLNAGVLEEGHRTVSEVGTVQGGSISPLLANVYLHYVFDRRDVLSAFQNLTTF